MNLDKTKVMFNERVVLRPIYVDSIPVEAVQDYVYLGLSNWAGTTLR